MYNFANPVILKNIREISQDKLNIFCPMCELEHENNTWCQFTGGEFNEIN